MESISLAIGQGVLDGGLDLGGEQAQGVVDEVGGIAPTIGFAVNLAKGVVGLAPVDGGGGISSAVDQPLDVGGQGVVGITHPLALARVSGQKRLEKRMDAGVR